MFIVNQMGRVVDLPARMEEQGLLMAREVLSISSELMNGVSGGVAMNDQEAMRLKMEILRRFPNVITDEEYMEKHGMNTAVVGGVVASGDVSSGGVESGEIEKGALGVDSSMTIKSILQFASENGVKLSKQESELKKDNLIEIVNERLNR